MQFLKHYAADVNPVGMLITGEDNLRDHVPGMGSLLLLTFVIAVIGIGIVFRHLRGDPWWRFIIYALLVSIIPAALTVNYFPQLRLITIPILLHVLMAPALQAIKTDEDKPRGPRAAIFSNKRIVLATMLILIIAQGAYFQLLFHRYSPSRWYFMDARFPRKVLEPASRFNRHPIYLYDPPGQSGYIQALWYGALRGVNNFIRLAPGESAPADSVVISTERTCANCRVIARHFDYLVYVTLPSDLRINLQPLPSEGFRAVVSLRQTPTELPVSRDSILRASIMNISNATWPCVSDKDGRHAVDIRGRWRNTAGTIGSDAGRATFDYDLEPGDVGDTDLRVTTPYAPGNYILEIDVVEEPDKWFGANGSKPLLLPIKVY